MSPLPSSSHFISLEQAIEMTTRYRNEKLTITKPAYGSKLLNCETFNRKAFDKILAEADCVAVRIYFSMDDDLAVKIIAVGVNDQDEDILPPEGSVPEDEDEVIVEFGQSCPPLCPPPSPLNS